MNSDSQDVRNADKGEEESEYRERVLMLVKGFQPKLDDIFKYRGDRRRELKAEFERSLHNVLQYLMDENDCQMSDMVDDYEARIETVRNTAMKYSDQAYALREEKRELESQIEELESRIEELEGDRDERDRLETLVEGIDEELSEIDLKSVSV